MVDKISHTDEEWRKLLTPEEYHMLREDGTEPPFRNKYHDNKKKGIYTCAGCGLELFSSDTKFDSGTGWPSYWAPIASDRVVTKTDSSYGMIREEVKCARCGGHLGHVFNDGPRPTGMRYCMNSGAMHFTEAKK
jgi:peptide-methionine (R)-S-oxide reductase